MRTCTGCRAVVPQGELLRVAYDGPRLVLDPARRVHGRGAYFHALPACVTVAGLSRSLRRAVTPDEVRKLVAEMSRGNDNSTDPSDSGEDPDKNGGDLSPGLAGAKTVETPPRNKVKEYRSEDASV